MTQAALRLRPDEQIGLAVAIAAHAALVVALTIHVMRAPAVIAPPERIVVSLAEDVALVAGAPEISEETQAAIAPEIADRPKPKSQPRPEETASPAPTPRVDPRTRQVAPAPQPAARPVGAEFGAAFREGESSGERNRGGAPAEAISEQVRASLLMAVARQLRPHWQQPAGVDVDKLRTTLEWELNPDGTLASGPRFVAQTGVNDLNRPQSERHKEQAMRAVRLAAPFNLPEQYYASWRRQRFTFDWTLN